MIYPITISVISVLSLLLLHRQTLRRIKALEAALESAEKSNFEVIQGVKLHLRRHEEILANFESERLSPIAKNIVQLHQDQSELLLYCTKLFADQNFGTNFQHKTRSKGAKI